MSNRRAELRQDGTRSGRLASTRRDRSLIFRRKVLALSKSWWRHPKEEDNIWCCLHQQPTLPQAPVRATTPIREERRKLVFNYSCTHPPFTASLPLSFFLTRLTARCHHPVHPRVPSRNILRIQPLSSLIPSVTQFWRTTSLWNYERQSGIHLHPWKTYIYYFRDLGCTQP